MSLYNVVHGHNPIMAVLCAVLDIEKPSDLPRLRDAYLTEGDDGELEIAIYTRSGGCYRAEHEDDIDKTRLIKGYLRDVDDTFDDTYMTFYFAVPDYAKLALKKVRHLGREDIPQDMHKKVVADLKEGKDTPAIRRAIAEIGPVFERILGDMTMKKNE